MTEYIVRDSDTGRAMVSSASTPVDEILQALQDGGQFDGALRRHPELSPQGVAAALRFARLAVERAGRPARQPGSDGFVGVLEVALNPLNSGGYGADSVTLDMGEYEDLISRLDFLEGKLGREPGRPGNQERSESPGRSARAASGSGTLGEVLASVAEKRDQLRDDLDLIESLHAGLEDVAAGRVVSHEDAMAFLRSKISG
ncbi:hypothetical protein [Longimicrobium sp.]|uniref:hypothetical protein n=1 Tax=Longimicrobium sp. TaxID=2029185 RepID=UPI002E316FB0|nr:hypothetical protein [Longimicrobium sp.]HEX6039488.1 hypothetical protein [Longimicrobium sp.]